MRLFQTNNSTIYLHEQSKIVIKVINSNKKSVKHFKNEIKIFTK